MSDNIIIDGLSLWVQIKNTKALNAMGVTGGAMLLESGIEDSFIEVCGVEFDSNSKRDVYSGYCFREGSTSQFNENARALRVPVECTTFDFKSFIDTNAEYFV